jgi:REP element-mobilizing transposase RayT
METKGWHSRGYLPHFDAPGVVQHIVLNTLHALKADQLVSLTKFEGAEKQKQFDRALDASDTGHVFKNPHCAAALERQLLFFDGARYDLLGWCIMPNHAHIVCCCLNGTQLGQIVRSWKVFATASINRILRTSGPVFAKDYYDRFMRDGAQTERAIAYVENNPVAAGLCDRVEAWRFSSAWHKTKGWRPRTNNLPLTIK